MQNVVTGPCVISWRKQMSAFRVTADVTTKTQILTVLTHMYGPAVLPLRQDKQPSAPDVLGYDV